MKLDKKQIQQLVVLGILVLVCIGWVSFQLVKPRGAAAPPAPAAEAPPPASSSTGAAATISLGNMPGVEIPGLGTTPARRDPFVRQAIEPERGTVPTIPNTAPKPENLVRNPAAKVPPLANIGPLNPFATVGADVAPAKQPEKPQDPEFTLTGVIQGDANIAIIRSGENGRYVVRPGQLIDGRYRVLSISDNGVTLGYKNRRIHVRLGGVKNAS